MNDFYQSPADKMRFEILLKSLREGNLNLSILGDDEAALSYYGKRIFQDLREQGEENVELWTSADSEKLVERFNEILSQLSLNEAQDKSTPPAPKRYMIFPDTNSIEDFEIQLLARLVNGFPASNINVILLVNRNDIYQKKLSAFGKNLLQWILESENPPEANNDKQTMRDEWPAAKENKQQGSNKPFAGKTEVFAAKLQAASDMEQKNTDDLMNEVPKNSNADVSGDELAASWAQEKKSGPQSRIAISLLGVVLLTVGLFCFLYWDRVNHEFDSLQSYLSGKSNKAVVSAEPATTASTLGMSSSTSAVVKPPESINPEKEELVLPNKEESNAVVAKNEAKPEVNFQPKPESKVEPTKPEPNPEPKIEQKAEPPKSKPAKKTADISEDKKWVNQLSDSNWVLQHAALETLEEAKAFQQASSNYKDAKILFSPRKGKKMYYIVLTGPFESRQAAQTVMQSNPALSKAWMRSGKSLKNQFQE